MPTNTSTSNYVKTSKDTTTTTTNEDVVELDPFLGNLLGVNYIPKCPGLVSETETTKNTNHTNKKKQKRTEKEGSKNNHNNNSNTNNGPSKNLKPAPQDVPPSSPKRPQNVRSSSSTTTTRTHEILSSTAASHDKNIKLMKRFLLNEDDDNFESHVLKQWYEERRSKRPGVKYYLSMSFICVLWFAFVLFFCGEVDDKKENLNNNEKILPSDLNANNNTATPSYQPTTTVTKIQEHKNNKQHNDSLEQISQMLQGMSQIMVVGIHHQDEKYRRTKSNTLDYSRIHCAKIISDNHTMSPTKKSRSNNDEENMGIVTYNENKQLVEIKQLLGDEWKCTVSSSTTEMILNYSPMSSSSSFTTFLSYPPKLMRNVLSTWRDNLPIQKFLESSITNVIDFIPPNKSFQEDDILADAIFRVL